MSLRARDRLHLSPFLPLPPGSLVRPKVLKSVHYCPATGKTMERKYSDLTSLEPFPTSGVYPTKVTTGLTRFTDGILDMTTTSLTAPYSSLTAPYSVGRGRQCPGDRVRALCLPRPPDPQHSGDAREGSCRATATGPGHHPGRGPCGQLQGTTWPRPPHCGHEPAAVSPQPGDRMHVVGTYRCLPGKKGGYTSGTFRTVLLACSVIVQTKEAAPLFSRRDVAKIKKFR